MVMPCNGVHYPRVPNELIVPGTDGVELRRRSVSLEALGRAEMIDARWQFGFTGKADSRTSH